jgi:hypothetical protein
MVFLDLPKEIVIDLLTHWLQLKDSGRLDSAHCQHTLRPVLLEIFCDASLAFSSSDIGVVEDRQLLDWVCKRKIAVEAMIIPTDNKSWKLDFDLLTGFLQKKGHRVLRLSETHYNEYSYGFYEKIPKYMNSSQLNSVVGFCPNLIELQDLSTESITLVSMGSLRRYCRNLRILSIQHHGSDHWDPTPLIALVAGGDSGITHLRLPSIQKHMSKFAIIARNLKLLQSLRFDRLRDISELQGDDKTFIAIAENCVQLKALYLPWTRTFGDSSLMALSRGCPALQELDVSHCTRLTSDGLSVFARRCSTLTALDLSGCALVTDEGVVALARHCTALRQLSLDSVALLTDEALTALGAHCRHLRALNLSYCELLTTPGLTALALGCPELTHLQLNFCIGLTSACVEALAEHCPCLRSIGVKSVNWITDAAVRRLLSGCPQLRQGGVALNGSMNISRAYRDELESLGALNFQ